MTLRPPVFTSFPALPGGRDERGCVPRWHARAGRAKNNEHPKKESPMADQVRAYANLSVPDVIQLAREQAERMEPCKHPYEAGSAQAIAWERHYTARRIELETPALV